MSRQVLKNDKVLVRNHVSKQRSNSERTEAKQKKNRISCDLDFIFFELLSRLNQEKDCIPERVCSPLLVMREPVCKLLFCLFLCFFDCPLNTGSAMRMSWRYYDRISLRFYS